MVPVYMKLRTQNEEISPEQLARLKKDHLLTRYSLEELKTEFEGITGENLTDILLVGVILFIIFIYCGRHSQSLNSDHVVILVILKVR